MDSAPGLCFRKLDLHVHSPASRCYASPEDTAEDIVRSAIEKGLDGIALTDHNTAVWVDEVKAAAKAMDTDGRRLVVFPGVEISAHEGYHVVAIFDPGATRADVENFLGAIGITPRQYGRSEEQCQKGIYEILELIHQRGGLGILAHIDSPKGAFRETTSREDSKTRVLKTCVDLFNDERYDAIEITAESLPEGFDGTHGIHRKAAVFRASDNPSLADSAKHSLEGIGIRYACFKLDEITIEGLRQCFADCEVRIRLDMTDNTYPWPHVRSMKIGEVGFLAYQHFAFHPGLNCIIGGKGAGKSLAIEFLRFGMGQPSEQTELLQDHNSKLDKRLGPMNNIEIEFQLANGVSYSLRRTYQGAGKSDWQCVNQATGEPYAGDVAQLFPVLAYSQTEVIKIAEDEGAQLRLTDSLFDSSPYRNAIAGIKARLDDNDRLIAKTLEAQSKVEDAREEVATLTERIANIDQILASPLLAQMRNAEARNSAFDAQVAYLENLLSRQREYAEEIAILPPPPLAQEVGSDPALLEQSAVVSAAWQGFQDALGIIAERIAAAHETVASAQSGWLPEFNSLRQRYESELRGNDGARLETERRKVLDQKDQAQQKLDRYRQQAQEIANLQQQRRELLDQLDQRYQEYYEARKSKFDCLTQASDGKLQLTITHASNREEYRDALMDLLKGSGSGTISSALRQKVAENVFPRALGEMIISRDAARLASESGLSPEMAERAMSRLWAADDLAQVLTVQYAHYPADTPQIRFNKGNGQYSELSELSVGQKCTALLIIALCDGQMPVIIDQPEDALDIASVWEDIAKKLRRGKHGRQFILTTHNSSLAVGGDSDTFMVLVPQSGDRAKVSCRGAIDRSDVRRAVVDHLEGGSEPYKLRHRKYNI